MPQRTEDELRDLIAQRLSELVEPGLKLLATEFHLPNFHGAKGFIDIVARDRFGLTVVIELKRSDAASRQALHELHKYTALLQQDHGLGPAEVRCVVLSTDWHELLVPFSSFIRNVPYSVTGYQVVTDEAGWPSAVQAVDPLPESADVELCPKHGIYLFNERGRRDGYADDLEQAIARCGIDDFLLLEIEYPSPPERVIYPFALYFAMAAIDPVGRVRIEQDVGIVVDPEEEAFGDGWFYEESVQAEINRLAPWPDSFEIGYPDKFSVHEDRWIVTEIKRYGRYASDTLRTDDDLISLVRAESKEHTVRFKDTASPQYAAAWAEMRKNLCRCLLGSGAWEQVAETFLDEVETATPQAAVEIVLFNPCDLLMAFFKVAAEGSPLYFPTLRLVVTPEGTNRQTALIGYLEWDGTTCPGSFEEVVNAEFGGDLFEYFLRRHVNELWPAEQRIAALHGLTYAVQEVVLIDGEQTDERHRLIFEGENLLREPPPGDAPRTFFDFCVAQKDYVLSIGAAFGEMAIGL